MSVNLFVYLSVVVFTLLSLCGARLLSILTAPNSDVISLTKAKYLTEESKRMNIGCAILVMSLSTIFLAANVSVNGFLTYWIISFMIILTVAELINIISYKNYKVQLIGVMSLVMVVATMIGSSIGVILLTSIIVGLVVLVSVFALSPVEDKRKEEKEFNNVIDSVVRFYVANCTRVGISVIASLLMFLTLCIA